MDAKSLREAMKDKAKRLASSTSEKVDSSTFTPAEPLDADAKTGLRPISKRAFKAGGKVDGSDMKHHAGRTPRKAGGRVENEIGKGIVNRDVKAANEERDGKKHVGGFKKGGRTGKYDGGAMGTRRSMPEPTQEMLDSAARSEESGPEDSKLAPVKSLVPPKRPYTQEKANTLTDYYKRGGKADKWEGSAKDEAQDKKLAKKHGMSMKAWEKSKADEKHDEQQSMKGLKRGGHAEGCTCKSCGGARMARKDGGKVKGKTNINIIISPHHDGQLGSMGNQPVPPVAPPIVPPRPPVAAGAPMPAPMPGPVGVPPGLGQTMPAAAGVPPSPPPGMPPMMARKNGGKVSYPKMRFGAGSGEGRLEKIEKYGKNA